MKRIDGPHKLPRLPNLEPVIVQLDALIMAAIMQDYMEPQMPHFIRMERRRRGF